MTKTYVEHYGKMYEYDRTMVLKRDAEALARDWERDGDKIAIVRRTSTLSGKRLWNVYWRRK